MALTNAPLARELEVEEFSSGVEPLGTWLEQAPGRKADGTPARTCVVCQGKRVVGYYGLAAGSVPRHPAMAHVRRNMPNPVPASLLGHLALDQSWQGRGGLASLFCATASCASLTPCARPPYLRFQTSEVRLRALGTTALARPSDALMITIEEAARRCA